MKTPMQGSAKPAFTPGGLWTSATPGDMCLDVRSRGCLSSPPSGLFGTGVFGAQASLYSELRRIGSLLEATVTFAGRHAFDPTLEEEGIKHLTLSDFLDFSSSCISWSVPQHGENGQSLGLL